MKQILGFKLHKFYSDSSKCSALNYKAQVETGAFYISLYQVLSDVDKFSDREHDHSSPF